MSEPSERDQHAGENAVGTEKMILADHIGKLVGTKLVGERPRRAAVQPGGGEQAWGLGFGPGGHRLGSSPSPQGGEGRGEGVRNSKQRRRSPSPGLLRNLSPLGRGATDYVANKIIH